MRHLISARDLNRGEVELLVRRAQALRDQPRPKLDGLVGLLFFESSTRTHMGFAAAAQRLGLGVIAQNEPRHGVEMTAAESLADTVRVASAYVDLVVLRHSNAEAVRDAVNLSRCGVISAGDGRREHPTQALADVLTLQVLFSRIDGLRIVMTGDLRHMRTAHSLMYALSMFERITVRCVSPAELAPPEEYVQALMDSGNTVEFCDELEVRDADVLYVAGFPPSAGQGRPVPAEARRRYAVDTEVADRLPAESAILCPLPRIDEIDRHVDDHPRARYFQQSDLALFMRMAVLERFLPARNVA